MIVTSRLHPSDPFVLGTPLRAVRRHGLPQRQGQRFERGLGSVMIILAAEHVHMNGGACRGR